MFGSPTRVRPARRVGLAAAVALGVLVPAVPAASAPTRSCRPIEAMATIDLGTLGGSATYATHIDDRGRVVGTSETTSGVFHAYRWERGVMTDLTPGLDGPSGAIAANDRGQVLLSRAGVPVLLWSPGRSVEIVGGSPVDLNERGQVLLQGETSVLWDRGTTVPIEAPAGSGHVAIASGLGDGGHVFGTLVPLPGPGGGHPTPDGWFVWKDGVLTRIDVAPYEVREVVEVDREGRALVNTYDPGDGSRALLWDGDGYVDLGSLGPAGDTGATDMNDRGQVVGSSVTPSGRHAFLWDDGEMIDLTPGAGSSYAAAISARGHVTGALVDTVRGFLWWCGELLDLGTAGVYVNRPVDVNARGQVVSEIDGLAGDRVVLSTPLRG